jgi:hypothetical protein
LYPRTHGVTITITITITIAVAAAVAAAVTTAVTAAVTTAVTATGISLLDKASGCDTRKCEIKFHWLKKKANSHNACAKQKLLL